MKRVRYTLFACCLILLVGSCGKSLKKDTSDCDCDDIWSMVKNKELTEIIEIWGQPNKRGGSVSNEQFTATWNKKLNTDCSGNAGCGEIKINWDGYFSKTCDCWAPLNTPTSIHCEKKLIHD